MEPAKSWDTTEASRLWARYSVRPEHPLVEAVLKCNVALLKQCFSRAGDFDLVIPQRMGRTLLLLATAQPSLLPSLEALLTLGANANMLVETEHYTILATTIRRRNFVAARALLLHGADPYCRQYSNKQINESALEVLDGLCRTGLACPPQELPSLRSLIMCFICFGAPPRDAFSYLPFIELTGESETEASHSEPSRELLDPNWYSTRVTILFVAAHRKNRNNPLCYLAVLPRELLLLILHHLRMFLKPYVRAPRYFATAINTALPGARLDYLLRIH